MDQSLQGAASAVRTIALQMLEERGRGAVLVGVARVDAALERLLLSVLLPSPGRSDALFQPDRPLGSFGARISLAHRLGLIESPVERALHTLRRVRNAFAHSSESASLDDPAYAERLAQAYRNARDNPLWAPLKSVLSKAGAAGEPPVKPALRDYIPLITILVAFLEATAQQLRPYQPPVVMGFSGVLRQDPAG
ncbi:hypothetical protein NZK33_07190 [Cyanobium sp. FGCU-6]|nr:hypothetical protein [Cyanobium sp. FGCU6]